MNPTVARMTFNAFYFTPNTWVPNNPHLPALLYPKAKGQAAGHELADIFEAAFSKHGWPPQWRAGVYSYHHYHSTAHEVLGCFSGHAVLMLGGPGGREIRLAPGDALVLPVGTGHCCVESSSDFNVVGAYPVGQVWDICKQAPTVEMTRRMARVPLPDSDPINGATGPVISAWKSP